MLTILGWYSLIISTASILINIGDDKLKAKARVLNTLLTIPIIIYITLNLFK